MILVTVGTSTTPFDRLLRAVDALAEGEELVVQHGPSLVRPHGAHCVETRPFDELIDRVRAARAVVTHAGVGTLLACLGAGLVPVVVPRRAALGEAVDDHQVELGRRLARLGVVSLVEDDSTLATAVAQQPRVARPPRGRRLAAELRTYVAEQLEPGRMRVETDTDAS